MVAISFKQIGALSYFDRLGAFSFRALRTGKVKATLLTVLDNGPRSENEASLPPSCRDGRSSSNGLPGLAFGGNQDCRFHFVTCFPPRIQKEKTLVGRKLHPNSGCEISPASGRGEVSRLQNKG